LEVGEMSDPAKVRRHAERVRELVASVVRTIKDPRLGMITITDSRITGDLRDATVYYTVLGDAAAKTSTAAALHGRQGAGAAARADPHVRPGRRLRTRQAHRRPARRGPRAGQRGAADGRRRAVRRE